MVRRQDPTCPECGAEAGEDHPARHRRRTATPLLASAVTLLLIAALALLSLDRTQSLATENTRLAQLAPLETDPGLPPLLPEPTPTPLPTPTRRIAAPTPAPTPIPRILPQPTPIPQIALPTPTPTPRPLTRAERIQLRRAELIEKYTQILDEAQPLYRVGQRIQIRLTDGTTQSGTLLQLASGQIELRLPTGENRWFFSRQLAPETRLRVDPSERQALVEERAMRDALRELQGAP